MYRKMEEEIENLSQQVAEQAGQRFGAQRLMTHPGMGPVTALATDVFLGDPGRFADGKALASYVGLIPREYSSGERQRLGGVTKQGSPLLRFLWCEAGAHAVRRDPELKRFYRRKLVQKDLGKHVWRWHGSSGSDYGSCCGTRLIIKSSVVAGRSSKAVQPVLGC
jgi:transposase